MKVFSIVLWVFAGLFGASALGSILMMMGGNYSSFMNIILCGLLCWFSINGARNANIASYFVGDDAKFKSKIAWGIIAKVFAIVFAIAAITVIPLLGNEYIDSTGPAIALMVLFGLAILATTVGYRLSSDAFDVKEKYKKMLKGVKIEVSNDNESVNQ